MQPRARHRVGILGRILIWAFAWMAASVGWGQASGDAACASCHEPRKKRNASAPDCAICHGDAHEVKAASSSEFRKAVPETCGMCHSDISQQYLASVHGKALERGVN